MCHYHLKEIAKNASKFPAITEVPPVQKKKTKSAFVTYSVYSKKRKETG